MRKLYGDCFITFALSTYLPVRVWLFIALGKEKKKLNALTSRLCSSSAQYRRDLKCDYEVKTKCFFFAEKLKTTLYLFYIGTSFIDILKSLN